MQFLEVMHPIFGYTKGNKVSTTLQEFNYLCINLFLIRFAFLGGLMEPLVQVGGRFIVLFCLVDSETRIQTKPVGWFII